MSNRRSRATGLVVAIAGTLAVVLGAAPAPAETEGAASVGALAEFDTNPRRRTTLKNSGEAEAPEPDFLIRAMTQGRSSYRTGRFVLRAQGALGAKLFFRERTERMVVGQAQLSVTVPVLQWATVRSFYSGKARTQVSGARSYTGQQIGSEVYIPIYGPLTVRASGTGALFLSYSYPQFSNTSLTTSLAAIVALTTRESMSIAGSTTLRPYFALGRLQFFGELADARRRLDTPVRLSLTASTTRIVFMTVGYTLLRNASNSRGESFTRHRAFFFAGTKLPMDIVVSVQGGVQITRYDDGVSVGNQLILADDDESQNTAQLVMSREWWFGVHTEARFAWYGNELAREGVQFQRVTSGVGLRMDL